MKTTETFDFDITYIITKTHNLKQYLKDTDWYYARKAETGEEVPADVVVKRKEAREFIRANEIKE